MIEIYKHSDEELVKTGEFKDGIWINIINPDNKEIQELTEAFDIPKDFLLDPLDIDEAGRVEFHNENILLLVRSPYTSPDNPEIFTTLPIGIIITNDSLLTICKRPLSILENLAKEKYNLRKDKRGKFILDLIFKISRTYLKYLKEINIQSTTLQREFDKSMKNKQLIKLLDIEKKLIYITTSLKSNEQVLGRIGKMKIFNSTPESEDLLEDATIENKQAIETAEIYRNILSKMMSSFSSIISNNLGASMKFLTSVTIVLMIPTLIASIYGMNVDLPLQGSTNAFEIILGITLVLTIMGILMFIWGKRK